MRHASNTSVVEPVSLTMQAMLADVLQGLAADPKQLPSRYLYDRRGAELFQRICELPDYYLARTEIEILHEALPEISTRIGPHAMIIEPGSGPGVKTRLLLDALEAPAAYIPIDLSAEQLAAHVESLSHDFPQLEILPMDADFTADFTLPSVSHPVDRRVVFFPGSTIGNWTPPVAIRLLRSFRKQVGAGGKILLGVDLQKERSVLEAAYDDPDGICAEFALNYLDRLNRELNADFELGRFGYQAVYNAGVGRIEMYLVSLFHQTVNIAGWLIELCPGERIQTEVSYKYTPQYFAGMATLAGLTVERVWTDRRNFFSVQLLSSMG